MSATNHAYDLRYLIINGLAETSRHCLLDPNPDLKLPAIVDALEKQLAAFEVLAQATSTSSRPEYTLGDMPLDEYNRYQETVHNLRTLRAVIAAGLVQ